VNIPNFITIIRLLLVPILVIFLMDGSTRLALLTFVTAGLGDALDGFLARLLNQKTSFGAYLDPIADKLLLVTSCVTLAILGQLPAWVAVIVVSRDVLILIGISVLLLTDQSPKIEPPIIGKITTFFQIIMVTVFLGKEYLGDFWHLRFYVIYVTIFFTILSALQYIIMGVNMLGGSNQTKQDNP